MVITPYVSSAMALKYNQAKEQAENAEDSEDIQSGKTEPAATRFYAAPVQISVIGSKADIQKLLDIFNESGQSLRVTSYEIGQQRQNAQATGYYTADIRLEVYMYKD